MYQNDLWNKRMHGSRYGQHPNHEIRYMLMILVKKSPVTIDTNIVISLPNATGNRIYYYIFKHPCT